MNRTRAGVYGLAGLVGLTLLEGCGGGAEAPALSSGARQFGSLQFTLIASKATYGRGEYAPLTFTVKNVGVTSVTVGSAVETYQIQVAQGSQGIWSFPPAAAQPPTPLIFLPGETKTFSALWPQTQLTTGQMVPPGTYSVTAFLPATSLNGVSLAPGEAQTGLAANPILVTIQGL